MEGKVVSINGFKAVGLPYFGDNSKGEIPLLWEAFNKQYGGIQHKSMPSLYYGICDSELDEAGRFHYAACVQVDSFAEVPEQMVTKTVEAGQYLVYTYSGQIKDLGDFYCKIFGEWLPASGHEIDYRPQLELYDHRFMETGEFDIFIPIK